MILERYPDSLPRSNLVELVMSRIQSWVANGDLKPGDKLPSEKEMCEHFRVSRSVIREAASRLNALHIIETYHGRGSFVSEVSPEQLFSIHIDYSDGTFSQQLWELRLILEPAIAELAAKRRTDEDLELLTNTVEAMRAALERGEPGMKEDDHFHDCVVKAIHNPMIEQIAVNIARMAEPYKRLSFERPFRSAETLEELIQIKNAVADEAPDRAYRAMKHHILMSLGTPDEVVAN